MTQTPPAAPPRTTLIRHFGTQDPIALEAYRAAYRTVRAAMPLPLSEWPVDERLAAYQVAQAKREGAIR